MNATEEMSVVGEESRHLLHSQRLHHCELALHVPTPVHQPPGQAAPPSSSAQHIVLDELVPGGTDLAESISIITVITTHYRQGIPGDKPSAGQVEGGEVQRQRHFDLHHSQAACSQGPCWGPSERGEAENLWLDGTS